MIEIIFWTVLAIMLLDFVVERYLSFLNLKALKPELPSVLTGIYDAENYRNMFRYYRRRDRFSLLSGSVSFVISFVFFAVGGFGWLDAIIRSFSGNELVCGLLFLAAIGVASTIISLPFSYHSVFKIEEAFGFNKSTRKTFWLDQVKGLLLGSVLGGGIYALVYIIYAGTGSSFWILGWAVMMIFSVFMSMFYSTLIVPLFNKQTPLEDGTLKDKIEAFALKAGFNLTNIFVIDGSKRSTKANAYFSGLGPKKRIVLYDTLINDLEEDEIVAVLAHEIGHYKHKHTLKGLVSSFIQSGVIFYVLSVFLSYSEISAAAGAEVHSFYIGLIMFGLLFTPVEFVLGLFMNTFSRKHEYQADAFAAKYGLADPLIEGLKKLSVKSLSNLTPHPWYVKIYYSHPTLLQRIEALRDFQTND